jgi:hypothetical protein
MRPLGPRRCFAIAIKSLARAPHASIHILKPLKTAIMMYLAANQVRNKFPANTNVPPSHRIFAPRVREGSQNVRMKVPIKSVLLFGWQVA